MFYIKSSLIGHFYQIFALRIGLYETMACIGNECEEHSFLNIGLVQASAATKSVTWAKRNEVLILIILRLWHVKKNLKKS